MGVFDELKRRNVFRVAVAYLVGAWFIAQIADLVLDNIGAPDWVIKALFLLLLIGFIAALIISWAYEITPQGIKREHEVQRDASITHLTAKKLDYVTLAAALGVAVMFVWQQTGTDRPATESASVPAADGAKLGAQSIAVLPFANRSNLEEDLYFTDGIHDDLLTQLAKINDLKVISRTSVMQYRDTDLRIPQIANELGVATVLEGGVQRAGQRIRINAQLIDVATDQHLWAETFDREMTIDNLFDIQTEITRHIVTAVRGQLTADELQTMGGTPTDNIAAYEAYLRARNLLTDSGYNVDKYVAAQPFAEQAVSLDPDFSLAHLLLVEIHGNLFWMGYETTAERQQAAQDALNKAATILSPDSPELLAAQSEYLYRFELNFPASQEALLRAHAAMPGNASILEKLGATQRRLGLFEESIDSFLQAVALDPNNASAASLVVQTMAAAQQSSRLEQFVLSSGQRFSDNTEFATIYAWEQLAAKGDVETTRARMTSVLPDNGDTYAGAMTELPWFERDFGGVIEAWNLPPIIAATSADGWKGWRELNLAMAYRQLGDSEQSDRLLDDVVRLITSADPSPIRQLRSADLQALSMALALQGEKSRAIEIAEEAVLIHPLELDKYEGIWPLQNLCVVLALTGERDRALELMAQLIDQPNGFKRWELYLDPRWDFFRDDDRFNELIRPTNFEQSIHSQKEQTP